MVRQSNSTIWSLALSLAVIAGPAHAGVGRVTNVEVTPAKERAIFVLSYEGEPKFRMFQSERQGTVVVEAENLSLAPSLTRPKDLGASQGPVVQLTPYNAGDAKRTISKFVLQLRAPAEVVTSELPGKFMLEIKRKAAKSAAAPTAKGAKAAAATPAAAKNAGRGPIRASWSETDALANHDAAGEKSEQTARRLVEVLNAPPEEKNYSGSPVTFEASDAAVHDVFRLVGEASGLNIITDSDVKGASNYALKDIPWDQMLDLVVQQNQLKAKVSGNVVRVMSLDKYNKEQEDKMKEISLADELEPVVMAVVPLSFAAADKMKATIETLLVNRSIASAGGLPTGPGQMGMNVPRISSPQDSRVAQDFVRGKIEIDARSNSLVITNTRDTIERIRRLVRELDVALPQVLIDTKIVIAHDEFRRKVGVDWGAVGTSSGSGRAGAGATLARTTSSGAGDTAIGSGSASGSTGSTGSSSSSSGSSASDAAQFTISAPAGEFLAGFRLGAGNHGNLQASLSLAEANNLSKTIASPRVIVNNNQEATVNDGQTINVSTQGGANVGGTLQQINAALKLKVKPQVTSSGAVLLDVDVQKSSIVPDQSNYTTSDKGIKTNVLVESGSTLVLGGVYQFSSARTEQGLPLLKDLPFIGQLFRANTDSDTKDELMVFMTPQILDTSSSTFGAGAEQVSEAPAPGKTGAM